MLGKNDTMDIGIVTRGRAESRMNKRRLVRDDKRKTKRSVGFFGRRRKVEIIKAAIVIVRATDGASIFGASIFGANDFSKILITKTRTINFIRKLRIGNVEGSGFALAFA